MSNRAEKRALSSSSRPYQYYNWQNQQNQQVHPFAPQLAAEPAQDTGMIQRAKVARAAFLNTGAFLLSSILGLLGTFIFSYDFGATRFSDAYYQAYIIPDLIYTVVAGGALSSAFIPVFTKYAEGQRDERTAWHIASSALNLATISVIVLAAVAMLLAPVLVPLYSPDFPPTELALTITLTRLMLFQAIVLGSGVIVSAILNTKNDFTRTAIGTVLYNVGQIIGLIPGLVLAFHARVHTLNDFAVYSATLGVVLGAVLQVGVQLPGLSKVGMRYSFAFDWRHPGVRQILRQMLPRAMNSAMLMFSTAVDRYLLSILGTVVSATLLSGLITDYFNAFSILVLPISLFGSSVATAAFPTLSSYVARERYDRVRSIIIENLRGILFLAMPSTAGLMVLALPIIQALLEHGPHFTLQAAQFTALTLTFFALGLPALAAIEILARAFYALSDTKTPVTISIAQFVVKIALALLLVDLAVIGVQWGMAMLALSTSIASILEALALFIILYRRIGGFNLSALADFLVRTLVATIVMALVVFSIREGLDNLFSTTSAPTLATGGVLLAFIKLFIEIAIGAFVYLFVARRLDIEEINSGPVRRLLNRFHITWL
jgi:putative peptidoglycan lipid II flippase